MCHLVPVESRCTSLRNTLFYDSVGFLWLLLNEFLLSQFFPFIIFNELFRLLKINRFSAYLL